MKNVLIFQPYLSNRPTSSGTVERQFRFLKYQPDTKVYALFEKSEEAYAETLKGSWVEPIVREDLLDNMHNIVKYCVEELKIEELYIARTYFTPATEENELHLKNFDWDHEDDRYWRDYIPMVLAEYGVKVYHMIYDPLELQYNRLIGFPLYERFSSMNNVEGAKPHLFADYGYYDKGKEVDFTEKPYNFIFGGTAFSDERAKLLVNIRDRIGTLEKCNTFLRVPGINNLIDNSKYEELASKALFTYTIPSQNPEYVSFTRMLLALSQGTIPLAHPDNNFDCLFGKGFEPRESLKQFFDHLKYSVEDVRSLLLNTQEAEATYRNLLNEWHDTEYYNWLQENL